MAAGILVNGSGQTASETTRFNTFTNDTIVACTAGCSNNYFDIVLTANATDITFLNASFNKSRVAFVALSPDAPVEDVIYEGRTLINPPPGFVEFLEELRFVEPAKSQ